MSNRDSETRTTPAQATRHEPEPNPDWSQVTAEQGLQALLAMCPGRPEEELTEALRAMPQREEDAPA